jgi:hypothetical protein
MAANSSLGTVLGQLEDNLPGMTHNPASYLDQLHLKAA